MVNRKEIIGEIIGSFDAVKRAFASKPFAADKMCITHTQGMVLHVVSHHKAVSIKDIAAMLGTTSSAATQIVDGLVNGGYLMRESSKEDRRAVEITLSHKSKKFMSSMKDQILKKFAGLFDVLSDDELAKYCELHMKLINSIPERK